MVWRNFVNPLAITSKRRGLATAVVYGLSLAVRFTLAAGEEVEVPPPYVQGTTSAISMMAGARAQPPYQDSAQPIVFRSGWPLVRQTTARACEPSLSTLMQVGLRPRD
jgi:hypothetical protein